MPTQQYSAILQRIYDDPNYFISILESNKDRLKSQLTYEKSKLATQILLGTIQVSDTEKIDVVVNYLYN